ncbi:MAG: hypothetical protein Ct9H300mP12_14680 [Acidimicrobiales bacterium]|nr:MAG: hypothetical protein Ct9H300mP12_14680 [Acidimicrobiales bacterium]
MFLDLTDEQKALQQELRTYFTKLMTPEVKARVPAQTLPRISPTKL